MAGLAAEVAFFGILSLFPALLAIASGIAVLESVTSRDIATLTEEQIVEFLERMLTNEAEGTIAVVERLFAEPSPGALSLGVVFALWASSRAFLAVINALDVAYDLEERRGYIRQRILAVGLAFGSLLVLSVMLAMLVVGPLLGTGQRIAEIVHLGDAFATFWDWIRWPGALVAVMAWAATVLHIGPNHRTPWRWDLPGAILAAVAWVALSLGFRLYLSVASGTNPVFGVLGGSLIVLLWFYLLAVGLIMGAELNAILATRRSTASLQGRSDA